MKGMEHPDITIGHLRIANKCSLSAISQPIELELQQKVGELEDRQNPPCPKLIKNVGGFRFVKAQWTGTRTVLTTSNSARLLLA
jgi:hypothetical protein